jgi:hypothetical protein
MEQDVAAGDIRTIKTFPTFFIGAVGSLLNSQSPSQYPILRHVNPDHPFLNSYGYIIWIFNEKLLFTEQLFY